jgi:hypothetical protein
MDKQRLLELLDALRADVAGSGDVDPAMLAELRRLTDEIRQSEKKQTAPTNPSGSAPSGLKRLLLHFEADHPQLSVSVGKVADALAAMGF